MTGKLASVVFVALVLLVTIADAQTGPPGYEVMSLSVDPEVIELPAGGTVAITVLVDITPPWHVNAHEPSMDTLIPTELSLKDAPPGVELLAVEYPEPFHKEFAFAGQELAVYEDELVLEAKLAAAPEAVGSGELVFSLSFQACDNRVCLPPETVETTAPFALGPPAEDDDEAEPGVAAPPEDNMVARLVGERGLPIALGVVFVLGLGLNLTPCVYPMVPITVGYFSQQTAGRGRRTLLMALSYQLGIVVTYSALGTAAALTGRLLGAVLQSPWVLAGVAAVMVTLALSLLGLYQIRPPVRLTRAVTGRARTGILGALAMGLVAGIVAAPCVAPVSAALLAYVGATGDPWIGLGMFGALSLGLGVPYVGLALASGHLRRLPRTGMWTVWVERLLGVVLLGVALYFVSPLLPPAATRGAAATLAVGGGTYLGWLAVRGRTGWVLSGLRMAAFGGGLAVAVMVFFPGAGGAELPWSPYAPERVAEAEDPVLLYFYADWCAPCRAMSYSTFQDERVIAGVERISLVRVDLTRGAQGEVQTLMAEYEVWGVATFILLDDSGGEIARAEGYLGAREFVELLEKAR